MLSIFFNAKQRFFSRLNVVIPDIPSLFFSLEHLLGAFFNILLNFPQEKKKKKGNLIM